MGPEKESSLAKDRRIELEKISNGSLDLISSPSPSVKIQTMGGKSLLEV